MPTGKRNFKMGGRTPQLRGTGKMSEDRAAWLRTYIGQFTYMRYAKTADGTENENGPNVVLYLPLGRGRDISYNFTALTVEELDCMEEFFQLMFSEARPIVVERDRVAREAFAQGDDSHSRVYRQVPQLIIRSRSTFPDAESVHDGSEGIPEGDGEDISPNGELRSDSSAVASDGSPESRSENAGQETDQP